MTHGWDQGGVAGWFRKVKTGFIGGVSAIEGRMGAVGMCDGINVDLWVEEGWRSKQEGGWEARRWPCDWRR